MNWRFIFCILCFYTLSSCSIQRSAAVDSNKKVEYQGHRGCRGLMPENTIPAFIKALDYVQILECDVVVSRDKQIIISHDPWMEAEICSHPDGRALLPEEDKSIFLYNLSYEEIKQFVK